MVYVDATLSAVASDAGGCCSDQKSLMAQFDLRVEKPAILASRKGLEPYIVGGKETSSYKNVVAILLGGELHCSGTVIGPRTIITAAHCINGYENRIHKGDMTYVVGSNAGAPETGPLPVVGSAYPRGEESIAYSPDTHAHDVGILFVKAEIPTNVAALHKPGASPSWPEIINKRNLQFVGFGYNKTSEGDKIGAGVKREASWMAKSADDWRFYFHVANNNTCKGDSGGPAFFFDEAGRSLLLIGLTSVGDADCTSGADTRVDAHYNWISARIQ